MTPEPNQHLNVRNARKRRSGFESLPATERDVVVAATAANQRSDPRDGALLSEIVDAMRAWYDDRRISPASVEAICLDLIQRGYLERVGEDRFQETPDAREWTESYIEYLGRLWQDTYPDETGRKVVIESRQIGADHGDLVEQHREAGE